MALFTRRCMLLPSIPTRRTAVSTLLKNTLHRLRITEDSASPSVNRNASLFPRGLFLACACSLNTLAGRVLPHPPLTFISSRRHPAALPARTHLRLHQRHANCVDSNHHQYASQKPPITTKRSLNTPSHTTPHTSHYLPSNQQQITFEF